MTTLALRVTELFIPDGDEKLCNSQSKGGTVYYCSSAQHYYSSAAHYKVVCSATFAPSLTERYLISDEVVLCKGRRKGDTVH